MSLCPGVGRHLLLTGRLWVALVPRGREASAAASPPGLASGHPRSLPAHACPRRSDCRSVRHVGRLLGWQCDKLRTADQQRMCDDLIEELGERTAEERGRDVAEKGQRQG